MQIYPEKTKQNKTPPLHQNSTFRDPWLIPQGNLLEQALFND